MTRVLTLALSVLALSMTSCGDGASSGPPEIAYGRDTCDGCHMIIEDPRFAAAYRLPDGAARRFDDLGEMVAVAAEKGELVDATVWAHDYDSEDWIDALGATYVTGAFGTPMGYQVAAFSSEARARTFAREHSGRVLTWDEVRRLGMEGRLGHHAPGPLDGEDPPDDGTDEHDHEDGDHGEEMH